jgi:hypothetical protein
MVMAMKERCKTQNSIRKNSISRSKRITLSKHRQRKQGNDRSAVSNIVTSIMMLGIVFTILGMVLTVYVPVWAKSLEAGHMEEVSNSFIDLKSTVDSQIAQGDVGTKFSTRIKLGTEGGPLLGLGQTTGGLLFQPDHSAMSLYNTNDHFEKYGSSRGMIEFESHNIYYVDQKYIYENGAIIMDQKGSVVMNVEPNLYVSNISGLNQVSIVFVTLQGDLENIGGIKSQAVQTTLLSTSKDSVDWGSSTRPGSGRNLTISVNTSYPIVWREYFMDLMGNRSGLGLTEYSIPVPEQRGDPENDVWHVYLMLKDVNRFSSTISYVETTVV